MSNKPDLYQELACAAEEFGEANDCTVKAVAVVTGASYADAHKALEDLGRVKRKGAYVGQWLGAIRALGFYPAEVPRDGIYSKTLATIEGELRRKFPGQRFLITTSGHLSSFDGSVVQDWARGSRRKVRTVYRVTCEDPA